MSSTARSPALASQLVRRAYSSKVIESDRYVLGSILCAR